MSLLMISEVGKPSIVIDLGRELKNVIDQSIKNNSISSRKLAKLFEDHFQIKVNKISIFRMLNKGFSY